MKIADLVFAAGGAKATASLGNVELYRIFKNGEPPITNIDLHGLLNGKVPDRLLVEEDHLFIKERKELAERLLVTISGEVRYPGTYAVANGERLNSVLKRAGGFTDQAFLKGAVFSRERVRRIEQEQLEHFVKREEERLLVQASSVEVIGVDKEERTIDRETLASQRELLKSLASRVNVGRIVIKISDRNGFEGSSSDLVLEDGDKLVIPRTPSSVSVIGAVRNSMSFLYEEEGVQYYLNRAGGLTRQADEKEIYILKADGSSVAGFHQLRAVEPGDAIIVPPKEEQRYRWLSVSRDWFTVLGQSMLSIAALATLL
jgi:protein involved in polysaccharide export with SLBB domain